MPLVGAGGSKGEVHREWLSCPCTADLEARREGLPVVETASKAICQQEVQELRFTQRIDHFDAANNATWQQVSVVVVRIKQIMQRYFLNDN